MNWLLLIIIAALLVFLRRRLKATASQSARPPLSPAPVSRVTQVTAEEELLAVITAAVAEFEGTDEFRVLSIKRGGRNWKLTARQELLHSRYNR